MAWRTGLSGKDRVPAQDDGQTHGVTWGSSIHDPTDHVEGEGAVVVVVEVDVAGSPHTTNGFIVIETPAPSGPVTMATVCQCDLLSGNDERSSTFRSACTPGAETSAPPTQEEQSERTRCPCHQYGPDGGIDSRCECRRGDDRRVSDGAGRTGLPLGARDALRAGRPLWSHGPPGARCLGRHGSERIGPDPQPSQSDDQRADNDRRDPPRPPPVFRGPRWRLLKKHLGSRWVRHAVPSSSV